MYNTHPKLYYKILGKKCVLYSRFYGMPFVITELVLTEAVVDHLSYS